MPVLDVPDNFGFVILTCGVLPLVTNIVLGGPVMKARKELDVQYPNLYAVVRCHVMSCVDAVLLGSLTVCLSCLRYYYYHDYLAWSSQTCR